MHFSVSVPFRAASSMNTPSNYHEVALTDTVGRRRTAANDAQSVKSTRDGMNDACRKVQNKK